MSNLFDIFFRIENYKKYFLLGRVYFIFYSLNGAQENFYRYLFTENISSLMGKLYQQGNNQKPDVSEITKILFARFPQEFPPEKNFRMFVQNLNRELLQVYSNFGVQMKENPHQEDLQNGIIITIKI